jgi:predicted small lipoprotein YifL
MAVRAIWLLAAMMLSGLGASALGGPLPPASVIAGIVRDAAIADALDTFGSSVRDMARGGELSANRMFLRHWEVTANDVFAATRLTPGLINSIDRALSDEEEGDLAAFYASPLGQKVSRLERALHELSPLETERALAAGHDTLASASPERLRALDRAIALGGPEIGAKLACQALRVMLLGLSLAGQEGEIDLPWADVDAQVEATAPGMVAQYQRDSRAVAAYLYAALDDAELSQYVAMLETPAMRHLYGASATALDTLIQRAVKTFGAELAVRLRSVAI